MRSKKYMVYGMIFILFLMTGGLSLGLILQSQKPFLKLGEYEVQEEEFSLFLQDEKALAADYFLKNDDVEYHKYFWETECEQTTPLDYAKAKALEKLIKVKAEQIVAYEYGVMPSVSFSEIKTLKIKDEQLYGAQNLELFQWYSIYHSKVVLEAKEYFKKQHPISSKACLDAYQKGELVGIKNPDEIEIVLVDPVKRETKKHMYGGYEGKNEALSWEEYLLKEAAYTLLEGESLIFTCEGVPYRVLCTKRKKVADHTYEEVKPYLEMQLYEEAFEKEIKDKIESLELEINKKKYKKIKMK